MVSLMEFIASPVWHPTSKSSKLSLIPKLFLRYKFPNEIVLWGSFFQNFIFQALEKESWINQDLHCVPSVVKLFFRELPEPLCTEKAWPMLKTGLNMATLNSDSRDALPYFKQALNGLHMAPYKALKHLMLHLQRVSERCEETGKFDQWV